MIVHVKQQLILSGYFQPSQGTGNTAENRPPSRLRKLFDRGGFSLSDTLKVEVSIRVNALDLSD
jgi:hypothetical protein